MTPPVCWLIRSKKYFYDFLDKQSKAVPLFIRQSIIDKQTDLHLHFIILVEIEWSDYQYHRNPGPDQILEIG